MAVGTARTRLTAEYFALALPGRHTQLVDGEIVVNEPSLRHQRILLEIVSVLREWTRTEAGRGEAGTPVDVHLDDHNVYAPDVWWVREERIPSRDAPGPGRAADEPAPARAGARPGRAVRPLNPRARWPADLHVSRFAAGRPTTSHLQLCAWAQWRRPSHRA